ncbi:MAG: hypothetical protein HYY06_18710 [Deltaproteobacteria bacterium]|nr:hypothetical protein [Deltaproteobacteria bacterium]
MPAGKGNGKTLDLTPRILERIRKDMNAGFSRLDKRLATVESNLTEVKRLLGGVVADMIRIHQGRIEEHEERIRKLEARQ